MKDWRLHSLRAVATLLVVVIFVLTISLGVRGAGAIPALLALIVYLLLVVPPEVRREFFR